MGGSSAINSCAESGEPIPPMLEGRSVRRTAARSGQTDLRDHAGAAPSPAIIHRFADRVTVKLAGHLWTLRFDDARLLTPRFARPGARWWA